MTATEYDIVVIGAGASGLAAARQLIRSGKSVLVLEARNRIGGRIFTHHPELGPPAELGAEFVHGKPPSILSLAKEADCELIESKEERFTTRGGRIEPFPRFWEIVESVNSQIPNEPGATYASFLSTAKASSAEKEIARSYVEGFNAADSDLISAQAVAKADRAAADIEGEKAFRLPAGYQALMQRLAREIPAGQLRLECAVRRIRWDGNGANVEFRAAFHEEWIRARQVVITVPLGVLQLRGKEEGAIEFQPPLPVEKLDALRRLHMGPVRRLVMEFDEPFWLQCGFRGGFLLADGHDIPTWWTQSSDRLVGWAGGPKAEKLSGLGDEVLAAIAAASLAKIFHCDPEWIRRHGRAVYHHDWSGDPFARGAYSYPGLGGLGAARILAEPIADTLFFAGEATDSSGHSGTVHAALESGYRVAREINRL